MKEIVSLLILSFVFASCSREITSDIRPVEIKCNNLINPSGTGEVPDFGWLVSSIGRGKTQKAYQIILDSEPGKLKSDNIVLWNPGKTISNQTSWISYSGPALEPATEYFWRVRIWDGNDNPSVWSKTGSFITGLFEQSDWENAKWIGYEEIPDSLLLVPGVHGSGAGLGNVALNRTTVPYFRKEFNIGKRIEKAYIFVSGLGHYVLNINGNKIGKRFLSPGWSNYNKTCLYNTFDVTGVLTSGLNAIGVIAGNGFYNVNRERYRKLVIAYGAPKMILLLKIIYSDGSVDTIVSDASWKCAPSPITFTSIYGGEDYNAVLEQTGWDKRKFDDSGWKDALVVRDPEGKLKPETDHPLMVVDSFNAVSVLSPDPGKYVYDFGQNASGIVRLSVKGNTGQKIRLIPGELVGIDSLVTQGATGGPYYFSYVLKGKGEEIWIPRFTYYGFRYVEVEGAVPEGESNQENKPVITNLKFLHTRNSSPVTGTFKCSNELFNSIYELINWSIKSNLASVATDCPHREKLGWLEQTHLMGNSIKYIYDIHNLFDKVIDDMIEAQLDNGLVPDIAPEFVPFLGGFRDSPEWGSACIILPWDMYEWYNDIDAVRKAYPMMKNYLNYLKSMSSGNILSHGLGDWYDLGPAFPGVAQLTPKAVTATSIYYYDAKLLGKMASLIGKTEDASYFDSLAEQIRISFNNEFFNPVTNVYSTGSQTAYAMPLFFGIVDDSCRATVVNNLVRSVRENNNALTAGDVGYRYLIRVLEQEGHSQLIFDMNSRTDVPGYGYQLSKGATSLTESWAGLRDVSNNHMMLGHLMEWFYSGIAGIQQTDDSKGYEHILINPQVIGDITWAEAAYGSIHGEIGCSWKIENGIYNLKVRIPANCSATVVIYQPDADKIMEGDSPLKNSESVIDFRTSGNKTYLDIKSGDYFFTAITDGM